jgi:hypothetical protein
MPEEEEEEEEEPQVSTGTALLISIVCRYLRLKATAQYVATRGLTLICLSYLQTKMLCASTVVTMLQKGLKTNK